MMKAKVKIESVTLTEHGELLKMQPVTNGSPEDNTFSQFTPSGFIELNVNNPELLGKFKPGQTYYVDFTPVKAN